MPSTLVSSITWSGYAVSTGAGTVSPTVSGYSYAWVGIDGVTTNSVEQIGTDSDYVGGQAHYYAWRWTDHPCNRIETH
jgi:hypothetical protein